MPIARTGSESGRGSLAFAGPDSIAPQNAAGCGGENDKMDAFVKAAQECRAQLLWAAKQMTHCDQDAEDVVQNALLKAFTKLKYFRGDAQMSTWLRAIVQNAALGHLRAQKRKRLLPLEYAPKGDQCIVRDFPDTAKGPEELCGRKEMADMLWAHVDRLSSFSRVAIQMCLLQELPYGAAARALNVNITTVKSRIFRGKGKLRRSLCPGVHATPLLPWTKRIPDCEPQSCAKKAARHQGGCTASFLPGGTQPL